MPEQCTLCKKEKEIERILNNNENQDREINSKVSWTVFWSIFGLSVTVALILMQVTNAGIYKEIDKNTLEVDELNKKYDDVAIDQMKINVQYAEIQKTLAEIKAQLTKIK